MKFSGPRGFTMIEILIVLAVLGILTGIAVSNLLGFRQRLDLDKAVEQLTQDLQHCRALSLAKSRVCRVRFLSSERYLVELSTRSASMPSRNVCNDSNFATRRDRKLKAPVAISGLEANDCVAYDTRGYAHPSLSTPGQITLSNGERDMTVVPSIVGAIRVVK